MSDKIVKLTGHPLPDERSEDVIATLRRLLADAERGELIGIAYATAHPNRAGGTGWTGEEGTKFPMAAMIMLLQARYAEMLRNEP